MPSIDFETYCGVCGAHCCNNTTVDRNKITITCTDCEDTISTLHEQIKDLEQDIEILQESLND